MINTMQSALIKKDLRSVTSNKNLFLVLIIVPVMMVVVIPTIFLLLTVFTSTESNNFQTLLTLLPDNPQTGDTKMILLGLMLNKIIPMFFLLIPIMASSVMAASSFIGEKEKRTLETLLYCPLSLKQIYTAKIFASFLLSMIVTLLSFGVMLIVIETELMLFAGGFILPDIGWLFIILLVSPAISFIAITLIVRGSAKAQTMEESQQRSVFLILPIIMLIVGQFTGVLMLNPWILLGLGIALSIIAFFLLRLSARGFTYEKLLK